jgi:hypothetical protein
MARRFAGLREAIRFFISDLPFPILSPFDRALSIKYAGGVCVVAAARMPELFRVKEVWGWTTELNSSPNLAFDFY